MSNNSDFKNKLCRDCRHYIDGYTPSQHHCIRNKAYDQTNYDLITGEYVKPEAYSDNGMYLDAYLERTGFYKDSCGPEGIYYEQ